MEKVRPWCGEPSDRGRLKNRTAVFKGPTYKGKERTGGECYGVKKYFKQTLIHAEILPQRRRLEP